MSATSSGKDVLRTLLVCITVVVVSYLGYAVVENVAQLSITDRGQSTENTHRSEHMLEDTRLEVEVAAIGNRLEAIERSIDSMNESLQQGTEQDDSRTTHALASVDRQTIRNGNNILESLEVYGRTTLISGGIEVNNGCLMLSPWRIEPPFTIAAEVRSDAMDVRLHATGGHVIFSWAVRPDELIVYDPATGKGVSVPGKGRLPQRTEWITISWTVALDYLQVKVGDQEVYRQLGDYSGKSMQVGFGTYTAKAVIKSFTVSVPGR